METTAYNFVSLAFTSPSNLNFQTILRYFCFMMNTFDSRGVTNDRVKNLTKSVNFFLFGYKICTNHVWYKFFNNYRILRIELCMANKPKFM